MRSSLFRPSVWPTLTLLIVSCTLFHLGQARLRIPTVPPDEYERTLRALDQYRALAAEPDEVFVPVTGTIKPGDSYSDAPFLIRRLSLLGDLPADAVPGDSEIYNGELVEAVKRFQSRHGLKPDGRIEATTLGQLNVPLRVRVRQLELAAERWRRHPYDSARPAIVLNLAEFRLRAYGGASAGPDPELEMKVVVGKAPDHKSPILLSQLDAVIFRPYWKVPVSIQRNELLPLMRKDPSWVSANNFELVTPEGELADEEMPYDDILEDIGTGKLQLRQKPGPKNSLGLVKFVFPNDYGVYMHDTAAHSLFARERRDLSHGCIRVEKPAELAEWVLREQADWPRERIDEAMQGSEPLCVKVKRPIQIVMMYSTASVMKNGEVHFFRDIYGEDAALEKELAARRK
ncbi:MAG TPA: L,D-transpeptidase family protein [Candidatus Solibacter sp.]|jgi:murein L,D-transpeptidase YcbB/YkuD